MTRSPRFSPVPVLCSLFVIGIGAMALSADTAPPNRAEVDKMFQAGNYKDAYDNYRKLALDPQDDSRQVGHDLQFGINALRNLGRTDETDAFREAVVAVHAKNWRLLQAAADSLHNIENFGYIVAGQFYRGHHRGGGRMVNSYEQRPHSGVATLCASLAARSTRRQQRGSSRLPAGHGPRMARTLGQRPGVLAAAISQQSGRVARL